MSYHIEITENELGVRGVPHRPVEHGSIESARNNLNSWRVAAVWQINQKAPSLAPDEAYIVTIGNDHVYIHYTSAHGQHLVFGAGIKEGAANLPELGDDEVLLVHRKSYPPEPALDALNVSTEVYTHQPEPELFGIFTTYDDAVVSIYTHHDMRDDYRAHGYRLKEIHGTGKMVFVDKSNASHIYEFKLMMLNEVNE